MSADLPPDPALESAANVAVAKAEAAATRRRWINLGEFVAVAGLVIGGIGLWLNWTDRRTDQAQKQAELRTEQRAAARYDIAATIGPKGDLLFVQDDRHPLGDVTLAFPTALGIGTRTTPAPSVPRDWYERALLKATDGAADAVTGTLPVLTTVTYWDGDTRRTARGIYDIVWRTRGGGLFGRSLHILGFRRHEAGGTQARVDALWTAGRGG